MPGRVLLNGNVPRETDFVAAAREALLSSSHSDAAVRESLKVVLITAGWEEHEYEESHVMAALREAGVPSRMEGGFDRNLQNLGVWHALHEFARAEPELWAQWTAREQLIEATRKLYLEKNSFFTAALRRTLEELKRLSPDTSLGALLARDEAPSRFDEERLLAHFLGRDVRDTVGQLIQNDDRMVALLADLEGHFFGGTGLAYNPTWRRLRRDLVERILSANSIFIFGGQLTPLHRTLAFFRLQECLLEALRRGTSFYTVSAGSLLMSECIIVYDDFTRREFQLFDRGFGLVRQLQVFPHCMDRIQTDDADNLAYLAHRFRNRTCVGLNEQSYLLVEGDPPQAVSVGRDDGVYVFDSTGTKMRYNYGESL